jgi:hypothetical protein
MFPLLQRPFCKFVILHEVALWQSRHKSACAEESPNIRWQDAEQGFLLGNTSSGEQKQFCLDRAVQQKAYRHVLYARGKGEKVV